MMSSLKKVTCIIFNYASDYATSFGQHYITDIGYTGHKHLESAGVIHMGGRVFDPQVGRFMSADPHIQAPLNSQSMNRYSYTLNNPLSFTDPSGYFFSSIFKKLKKLFDKIKKIIKKVVEKLKKIARKMREIHKKIKKYVKKYWRVIVAVVVAVVVTVATMGIASGVAGVKAASGVAKALGTSAINVVKVVAHGLIGGLRAVVNGGKFLAGFISGAVGKAVTIGSNWLSNNINAGISSKVVKGLVVATVGGLAAELTGGEFAAGFIAAGVAFATNELSEKLNRSSAGKHLLNQSDDDIRKNAPRDLGNSYRARVDSVPNTNRFEVHVYRKSGKDLLEVGLYNENGFFPKHGIQEMRTMPNGQTIKLNGLIMDEASRRNLIIGNRRGFSRQLFGRLGGSLAGAAGGYLQMNSLNTACSIDAGFEGC